MTQSFKLVNEHLDRVTKGLTEMQTLATGVGDLKKILGVDPLKITLLKCGTFEAYERKYNAKIRAMNPENCEINDLLVCHQFEGVGKGDLLNEWI